MTDQGTTHQRCFDRAILADLSLGRLPDEAMERVATEVETCQACQTMMETLDHLEDPIVREIKGISGGSALQLDPALEDAIRRAEEISRVAWADELTRDPLHQGPAGEPGPQPPPPARLGPYELLEQLGRGGMGTVWKAFHARLKRPVALKLLSQGRTRDPQALLRFLNEMEAVGRLHHPHLVGAHDAGEVEGQYFLAMEYLDGTDLAKLVHAHTPLAVADACEMVRQTALGLQYAHEHGLVHRDVKPSNLMLTREGAVKVLDLGLARLTSGEPEGAETCEVGEAGEMTASGQIVGTGDYLAPEQAIDSHAVDIRADIYALGCTLYKLLAGRAPFESPEYSTPARKVLAHAQIPPPAIRQHRAEVPELLAAIVDRMLAKDPGQRFSTPAEVAAALEPFAAGNDLRRLSGISPLPRGDGQCEGRLAASPPRRRRWLALAAGGAAAAIFLGIVFLVSTGEGTVKLEFADADAARQCTVSVDGNEIRIEKLVEPIKLRAGKHQLRIRHGDLEIETREFDVLQRGTQVLHVSIPARAGDAVAAVPADTPSREDTNRSRSLAESASWQGDHGAYEEAVVELSQAIALTPDDVAWWYLRAEAEAAGGLAPNGFFGFWC
jgi:serine/threonine protein kinase